MFWSQIAPSSNPGSLLTIRVISIKCKHEGSNTKSSDGSHWRVPGMQPGTE